MLLDIFEILTKYESGFNLFRYITTRSVMAAITSLLLGLMLGPYVIAFAKRMKFREVASNIRPDSHQIKHGTPTMGGILIVGVSIFTTLLWADISNRYIHILVVTVILFALIGLGDDWMKLKSSNNKGMSAGLKFLLQSISGIIVVVWLYASSQSSTENLLIVPFFKEVMIPLGPWFMLLSYLTIVGASNGVNLSDGLDGLVVFPLAMIIAALGAFAYISGNINFSNHLNLPYLPAVGEALVFCSALVGACLGFLWFNTYPAQIFLGDVGALSLGATVGMLAVLARQELLLVIMGGIFVVETVSVALQIASFKIRKRRIFRMAPLHHHFELSGIAEPKLVVRFWLITLLLVLIGLASLKIR